MKTLVVYDSVYGNTEKIARAIGGAIAGEAFVLHAKEAGPPQLKGVDLLVVGAPTQAGRPTPPVQEFLDKLDGANVEGLKFAAFDTRVKSKIAKIFGYAAPKIASALEKKGARPVAGPDGFFVGGKEGPVSEGEEERAAAWAKTISG